MYSPGLVTIWETSGDQVSLDTRIALKHKFEDQISTTYSLSGHSLDAWKRRVRQEN